MVWVSRASAEPSERHHFNIPAGDAAATLLQCSSQADVQIIFQADKVKGIRTAAVEGDLTPEDALHRLLAGSELVAVRDQRSGAFAVSRAQAQGSGGGSDPNGRGAAPLARSDRPERPSNRQTGGDETVTLSPFEVSATTDVGYVATETLSGTRLRSKVSDLGNAMTIMTDQFLDDIGAVDFYDALDHAPSTSAFQADSSDPTGNSTRFNTQYRSRGFRMSQLSVDFFTTAGGGQGIPPDRYNTENLTLARGPNSILYGISDPGGVINVTSKRGLFGNNFAKVETRFASYDSVRVAADVNRELLADKVALRVDLLNQKAGDFRGENDQRRAAYASLHVHPIPQADIYVNYEFGTFLRHVASALVVNDWYTPWVKAGRPIDTTPADGTNGVTGLDPVATANYLVYIPGQSQVPVMNWKNMTMGAQPRNPATGLAENNVSLTDPSVEPLTIDLTGPQNKANENYDTLESIWDLRPFRNLNIELGTFREERSNVLDARPIQIADESIAVDTNAKLPNGSPNPNVGRPYVEAETYSNRAMSSWDSADYRASAAYDLDLSKLKLGSFDFGQHRLLGLMDYHETRQMYQVFYLVNTTPLSGFNALLSNAQNKIHTRTYLQLGQGDQHIASDFTPFSQDGVNADWVRTTTLPRNTIDATLSRLAALQSTFWNHRIATVVGMREDNDGVASATFTQDSRGLYPDPAQSTRGPMTHFKGDTSVVGAVFHVTDPWSLTYNRSKSFTPPGVSLGILNQNLPPSTGIGQDIGIRYDLDSRLSANLVYFKTQGDGQIINSADARGNKNAWINAIWTTLDPSQVITNTGWRDSEDFVAKGWEFQLTGNLTPRWQLAVAASENENVMKAYIPHFQEYYAANRPLWLSAQNVNKAVSSTAGSTVGAVVKAIDAELADDLAQVGSTVVGQSKWLVDLTTNYSLPAIGPVTGLSIGGNYHWDSPPVIGYGTTPDGSLTSAVEFHGNERSLFNAWLGWRLPLGHGRQVKLQLNVRNVFNRQHENPLFADQGLNGPFYESQTLDAPRTYIFTSTFQF